jgi:microcystin degradation protein MlrC
VRLALGHHLDPRWGSPADVEGRVVRLSDGRFHYRGGIWNGVQGDMGPSAVLAIGGVQALVTTHATYDWLDEQYLAVELDPTKAQFVVVKNPMNYRLAYGDIAKAVFLLDTPGPTPASYRSARHRRLPRPYFPLDQDIPGLQPTILTSRRHR